MTWEKGETPLLEVVDVMFRGELSIGAHEAASGCACVLEAASCLCNYGWTDDPLSLSLPDLRAMNDSDRFKDGRERAEILCPVVDALWCWDRLTNDQIMRWIERVLIRLLREVFCMAIEAWGSRIIATGCKAIPEPSHDFLVTLWTINQARNFTKEIRVRVAAAQPNPLREFEGMRWRRMLATCDRFDNTLGTLHQNDLADCIAACAEVTENVNPIRAGAQIMIDEVQEVQLES